MQNAGISSSETHRTKNCVLKGPGTHAYEYNRQYHENWAQPCHHEVDGVVEEVETPFSPAKTTLNLWNRHISYIMRLCLCGYVSIVERDYMADRVRTMDLVVSGLLPAT